MSLLNRDVPRDGFAELSCFRTEFYACMAERRDALFELGDALLVLAGLRLPRTAEGRLVLAVDVSNWLRPDANTSPDRLFCHTYGRGRGSAQMIPGWPYSFVAALEPGRTSWTAMLDVLRLCPWDDGIAVTAVQVREVFQRLYVAGQWQVGDPPVLVVVDAGYDVTRPAFLLADLPVDLLGPMRSDRVLYFPPPPQPAGKRGRKPKRGAEFTFEDPATQPVPSITTTTDTTHYGKAVATAWDRLHPLLVRLSAWANYPEGQLPIIEGTVIRLQVDHLRGDRSPRPVWLWWSLTDAMAGDVDRLWQAFLRRFDLEHTFRRMKQTLGSTAPKLREPAAADRWTWLVIAQCREVRGPEGVSREREMLRASAIQGIDQGLPESSGPVIQSVMRDTSDAFAPGLLCELTQVVPLELVDAVLEETGARERRLRCLPSRVGVYFVLALGLFGHLGARLVWTKLVAGLTARVPEPSEKALRDLRRRIGPAPVKRLFEVLAGPLAQPSTPGVSYRRWRTVAFDGCSSLIVPDHERNWSWLGRPGSRLSQAGYPRLMLMTLCETGTRGLIAAAFGPVAKGETYYAQQLTSNLGADPMRVQSIRRWV